MRIFLSTYLLVSVSCRPQGQGFNPGKNSGQSGSGSGFNSGDIIQDSGFNPGQSGSGSGFNPQIPDYDESVTFPDGRNGESGFNPGDFSDEGSDRPSSIPDDNSGFNPGSSGSGFNPGYSAGSESDRPNSQQNGNSGFNPGSSGFNPGRPGGAAPGASGFRTPIIFADDNEVNDEEISKDTSLPPYQSGGDKTPFLRQDNEGEEEPKVYLLQQLPYNPLIEVRQGDYIPASTLPMAVNGVQTFPAPISLAPYVPGANKQQYLRGRQTKPVAVDPQFVQLLTSANPLTENSVQTLPSPIAFAPRQPYVPGSNKQQYLRGNKQTKPITEEDVQYVPLIQVRNQPGNVGVSTLPSPITFAEDLPPYVPGGNKQQYLRGNKQTRPVQYVPLLVRNVPGHVGVSTLPSPITFAEEAKPYIPGGSKQQYLRNSLPAYVPGGNKQQYLRGDKVTKPFLANSQTPLIEIDNLPENIPVQTLPSGITFAEDLPQYVPGSNKEQYLRGRQGVGFTRSGVEADQGVYPGVSTRPNFPPGYYPSLGRMFSDNLESERYDGPKNVLYFF